MLRRVNRLSDFVDKKDIYVSYRSNSVKDISAVASNSEILVEFKSKYNKLINASVLKTVIGVSQISKCISAPKKEVSRAEIFVQPKSKYSMLIKGFELMESILTLDKINILSALSQVVSKLVIEAYFRLR